MSFGPKISIMTVLEGVSKVGRFRNFPEKLSFGPKISIMTVLEGVSKVGRFRTFQKNGVSIMTVL